MKFGNVVTATEMFYDPNGCQNRNDLPDPRWRPLHEQIELFIKDPKNNVVNPEKINMQQLGPWEWMMIYQTFVEDDKPL